ncbi:NACHT domain-containing protein [Nostoc sp. FACHB-87]|uniref:NACHT domain-containing protein n=1 Tax=Nostocaceae TaxID=1162 RepID=UPI0016831274|nr:MULTISPECIES: NACHT domain-containing protein [Nostocaceae]MBD2455558.1 NACHT domain-containing protein [Nostoc sp. FACHB-87]MBD2477414.1 NACHT domain-containing protein [Anabaena sp. FACHB-83]
MSRNLRKDESALDNVLSLVEALLQLSQEQECESKLPLCVVWNANKLQITGYKSQSTRGNRSKIIEVGTKQEYLLNQIKNAGKTLKLPPQKAESNVSQEKRELQEVQIALDWLWKLGLREPKKAANNQGYWKFTLTLKHQTASIKDNLEVVKQRWKEYHQKPNLKETSQEQTTDNSFHWQNICGTMLKKHKRLTTNEFFFAYDDMKFELEEIHVPLALVERKKPNKCSEDISPEQGSRLYEPSYEEKQRFEHQAFLEQIIRDGVGKTQGHRIALIGEPGAGKTTQLQTIAFWILNKNLGLPIWISLADLQGKSVEDYLLQNWLKKALKVVRVKEEQENFFADLFKNNFVWLLLDAADEMSSPQPLTQISQQLTGWVKNARVVLTCRVNVWEANANALENFETYRLLNFAYPQQVQEFIGRWFHNRNADKGERLWQELDKPERQRIQDLVKNPLRLALLCSTWQSSDKGLPETKAGLYQQFVEEVYKWKENRFPTTEQQQEELNAALGRLAKRAIDQETSRFRLRHKFVREELGDAKQQNSLFWLALKLGWLNEVGLAAESTTKEKVYAFYHPTFEEYFAALAVDDWQEFLNHVPDNPTLGVYRIFAPQWKEVILLWLGREDVSKLEKEAFLKSLVEFDDGCRGFYGLQAYFLAAVSIAEFETGEIANKIIEQLIEWTFGSVNFPKHHFHLSSLIAAIAKNLLLQTHYKNVVDALHKRLKSSESQGGSLDTALILLEKSPGHELAVRIIVDYIDKSPAISKQSRAINLKRIQAISKLKEFAVSNPLAIATLANLSVNKQNHEKPVSKYDFSWLIPKVYANNREKFLDFLERIDINNIGMTISKLNEFNTLIRLLGVNIKMNTKIEGLAILDDLIDISCRIDDSHIEWISGCFSSIHLFAINRLAELASTNSDTITNLIETLYQNNDNYIRQSLMMSLGKAACININATKAVLQILKTTEDEIIADAAIYFLKKISNSSLLTLIVTELKDYIEDAEVYEIIWHCAQSIPYPAFYQAWHQQEKVKDGE